MHAAVDEGMTFFDNAWDYHDGYSEIVMGKALATGRRDKVFLMTKGCDRDYAGAMRCIDESLKRLQTDYLDLWQFHEIVYDNDPDWVFEQGGIRAAIDAKQAGKIRHIGFTGHRDPRIHQTMLDKPFDWETVQLPINMMDAQFRSFLTEIVPQCVDRGAGVIGMKTLGGGVITGQAGISADTCSLRAQPTGVVHRRRYHLDGRVAAERGERAQLHADAGYGPSGAARERQGCRGRRALRVVQDDAADGRAVPRQAARLSGGVISRRAEVDEPQHRVYRSALGRGAFWKTFPLAATALVFSQPPAAPWGWAGSVVIMTLAAWFLLGTTYRIESGTLVVRQLFRRVDIPLTRITAVRPRTPASRRRGPMWPNYALGTALIEIDDAGWTALVSPRDEKAFLAELAVARQAAATSEPSADSPPTCFRSVIGKRLRFLMAGPVLGLTGIGMATAGMVDIRVVPELALLVIAVAAASVEFSNWVFRGVRYTIEDGTLIVRRRWRSRRIPLDTITAVDRIDYDSFWALSDTLGNKYMLGTDVLAIRCGDGVAVNVSPPDEDAFLRAIGHSAPASRGTS